MDPKEIAEGVDLLIKLLPPEYRKSLLKRIDKALIFLLSQFVPCWLPKSQALLFEALFFLISVALLLVQPFFSLKGKTLQ
jgi:hypothetical protein